MAAWKHSITNERVVAKTDAPNSSGGVEGTHDSSLPEFGNRKRISQ
jgi:hypothetical protein